MYSYLSRGGTSRYDSPELLFADIGTPNGVPRRIAGRIISALLAIVSTQETYLPRLLPLVTSHKKVQGIPDIGLYLATQNDLERFILSLPQYFKISGSRVQRCTSFTEEVFNAAITKKALEICPPRRSIYTPVSKGAAAYSEPDDLVDVLSRTKIIDSVVTCNQVLDPILDKARREIVVIGLDCEGVCLGSEKGCLTLVQISTWEGKAFLFDAFKNPQLLKGNSSLKKILERDSIVKVIHDCRSDTYSLYHEFGVTLTNVFDTQIAMSTLMAQLNRNRTYKMGFKALCEVLGKGASHKDDDFVKKMIKTPDFWKIRPLSAEMMYYAASDALCLVPTIYLKLKGMMTPLWRDFFLWSCEDTVKGIQKPRQLSGYYGNPYFGQLLGLRF